VRIDTGVQQCDVITPFYDPMIAKLIVWDETRELALTRMRRALSEYQVVGVTTNIAFLKRLVTSPSFVNANLDTSLIEREKEWLLEEDSGAPDEACLVATLAAILLESDGERDVSSLHSPWAMRDGWRLCACLKRTFKFVRNEREYSVLVEYLAGAYRMTLGARSFVIRGDRKLEGALTVVIDGNQFHATVIEVEGAYHVFFEGESYLYRLLDPLAFDVAEGAEEHSLVAPMPGRLVTLLVQPGDDVEEGTPLLMLEAMKMEYTVMAPTAGRVQSFLFAAGDQVPEGAQLMHFERAMKSES
jgi:3-methylcrotonyl-CoA carboxylase alpha subunit